MSAAALLGVVPDLGVPACRGIPPLAEIADGQRLDGRAQRVVRREDAVGDGRVQMGVAVEPRAEAVKEGDGAEPGAEGRRRGLLRAAEALETEQRLDLRREKSSSPPRWLWGGLRETPEYSIDFLPKVKIEVVVSDDEAQAVISKIMTTARTGQVGDGKNLVMNLADVVRIRTGETAAAAI